MSINAADVREASARLHGRIHRTPLLESLALNNLTGARILVKADNLQIAGSFKIRGAMNRVLKLSSQARSKGVVAFSSGNFGQGLAAACGSLNVPCTIVMPGDAPVQKELRAVSYGASVVRSELVPGENREVSAAQLAEKLSKERGFTLLHPFEDADTMAGQGTAALEIAEDCKQRGIKALDALLVPTGGGGLLAGCCCIMADVMPETAVYSVEPEGYDDHLRSFQSGERVMLTESPPTLCDSLQAVGPGENTWPINSKYITGVFAVSDDEVRYAMKVAFETLQIVLEPGGATGLAAVLAGKLEVAGRTLCVHATGGNLSLEKFARVVGCKAEPGSIDALSSPAGPRVGQGFDWTGFQSHHVPGLARPLLLIKGEHGYLACGYIDLATCDKFGEAAAIVTGVNSAEDMLDKPVQAVSQQAAARGVKVGMSGTEALELLRHAARSKL